MFLAIVYLPGSNAIYRATDGAGNNVKPAADLKTAKSDVEAYMARNKATFANGYDIYVIDMDTKKIAATASIPTPSLEWKDAS